MTDINDQSFDSWIGSPVVDREGNKIGTVSDIYLDELTGRAEWLTINTGLFKTRSSFVPLSQVAVEGDQLKVPYDKTTVKDAPQVEDGHAGYLAPEEEESLYRHYDGAQSASVANEEREAGRAIGGPTADATDSGEDRSERNTDEVMTRSEERLEVGRQRRETGRARIRKYVVTEQVTQTVPVSHEELRVEREPITDADVGATGSGAGISEDEREITLYEERPVVQKEVHPMERVRLSKEAVTGEETVSDKIRKEVIEPEDDTGARPHPEQSR